MKNKTVTVNKEPEYIVVNAVRWHGMTDSMSTPWKGIFIALHDKADTDLVNDLKKAGYMTVYATTLCEVIALIKEYLNGRNV